MNNKIYDFSQINTYTSCPRKYYNKYILGLKKIKAEESDIPREFGSAIHKALELRDLHGIDKGLKWFKDNYQNIFESNKIHTTENGIKLLQNYIKWEKFNFSGMETLAVELQDEFKVGDNTYTVKIDKVMKLNDNIYVIDYKTTQSKSPWFFNRFDPNMQVSGYCKYVKDKFGDCSGFIPIQMYFGCTKKNALFDVNNQVEANKYANNEVKYCKHYKKDMIYASGFNCNFDYQIINRNSEQLDDFVENATEWISFIKASSNVNAFPKNESSCMDFKGCEYRDMCKSCDDESVIENLYEGCDPLEYLKEGDK